MNICQDLLILPIFLLEPLVSASAGATPPLYGILRGLLGWNSTLCGGMKLIFFCFALPNHIALSLWVCHSLEQFDLFGGCRTQSGPLYVLVLFQSAMSIFSTTHAIFSTLVLF